MEIKEVAGVDKFDYSVLLLFFLNFPCVTELLASTNGTAFVLFS